MPRLPEEMLHALWGQIHRLVPRLTTVEGEPVEVLQPGTYNRNAGPDYLNAVVVIGGVKWVGDVEIHVQARAWTQHGHHIDPAYSAVVLHAVAEHDAPAIRPNGQPIPTLVFPNVAQLLQRHQNLLAEAATPRCHGALANLSQYARHAWLTRLLVSRLERKAQLIAESVLACELGWEEAFYHSLARSLGLTVNAESMLALARSIPLKALYKVLDTPLAVEAILFGQAGLLPTHEPADPYSQTLAQEYAYQRHRFRLQPDPSVAWRYMRMRPAAFPTLRIAQLASLLCRHKQLLSRAIDARSARDLEAVFRCAASAYWDAHYRFGDTPHTPKPKRIGQAMIRSLLLNSVIPFRFAYAQAMGLADQLEEAIDLLQHLPPETNAITTAFAQAGVPSACAAQTQALAHLHRHYCLPHRCYLCPAGFAVLTCDFCRLSEDDAPYLLETLATIAPHPEDQASST